MPDKVNLVRDGEAVSVDADSAQTFLDRGWKLESATEAAARTTEAAKEDEYGGTVGAIRAGVGGVARGATFGASDVALRVFGGEDAARDARELRDRHKAVSIGSEVLGSFATGHLPGQAGAKAASIVGGEGIASQLGRSVLSSGTEGALYGAGQGVSELALSDDPLTVERMASTLGSNIVFGAATGGAVGAAGKGLELGLGKAKSALDKIATREADAAVNVGDDIAKLDRKGLRAAEKQETEAIQAARVPERAKLADDIKAFRQEARENKLFLATKDAEGEVREVAARAAKADKRIRNLLDNPIEFAEKPQLAKSALQQQEAALKDLIEKHGETLRAKFASDTTGTRMAALDYAPVALEKNRALQAKIAELTAKPTSARLEAISDAMAGLGAATKKEGATVSDILGQSAMGHAVGMLAGVPYLGQAVLAAKATGSVMKKLGANAGAAAERGSKAISTFLDVGSKAARPARVVASKVLANARFGEGGSGGKSLAADFHARAGEIRSLTAPGIDGAPVMRPEARAKVAERLAPVRAVNPLLADRIETNKAAAVEFLANKLPRRPDLPGIGADSWQPSDMEMRAWARYVAAVEDPHGIIERLASGDITPEDAEAMRTVYPEMYADVQRELMGNLGELRAKLPYQRRLALSIFSGVAVDPAMDPRVLAVLQGSFAAEEGTNAGTQAPRAQPQFGSVTKEKPTPAQERAG